MAMSPAHTALHGLTMRSYKTKFPKAPLFTPAVCFAKGAPSRNSAAFLTYCGEPLSAEFYEFLTGALLGDGSLEMGKKNARYAEGGSREHYIQWKYMFLKRFVACRFKKKLSAPHSVSKKRYWGWWLKTTIHPEFTAWRGLWYPSGIKRVPRELVDRYLTRKAFAVWFCDDGHMGVRCKEAYIYTHSFRKGDVQWLIALIARRFGVRGELKKVSNKRQYFIRFPAAVCDAVRALVAAEAPEGMEYKYELTN